MSRIPVTGNVAMTPGTVTMSEPGEVVMKKPGEVVMKTPGTVTGTLTGTIPGVVPRPSDQQWNGSNPNPPPNNNRVVTNYTIFKSVPFGSGKVSTGWVFSSSEQATPESQYCYYSPNPGEVVREVMTLVSGGQITSYAQQGDGPAQLAQCVWFDGQPPVQKAPLEQPGQRRAEAQPEPSKLVPVLSPSFDCEKPGLQPMARLICSNQELAKIDLQFNQAYLALRHQIGPGVARKRLQQEDVEFIKTAAGLCRLLDDTTNPQSVNCVKTAYTNKRSEWLTRANGPAREEASRPIEQHIALQAKLQELGFYPADAKVDGVYGDAMRQAIASWQTSNNLSTTGFISAADADLLRKL